MIRGWGNMLLTMNSVYCYYFVKIRPSVHVCYILENIQGPAGIQGFKYIEFHAETLILLFTHTAYKQSTT